MAYNRRSGGGGGFGGYSGGGGGGGGYGGRFNAGGGYRAGAAGSVNPWQTNAGGGGPMPPRQQQQGGHHPPPSQLAMASNIISKLLTSSNSMPGSGYGGNPNRSGNWGSGPRMGPMGMRRQDGPGPYSKDNRRRGGGDSHNKFSGGRKSGGGKDGEKRKSTGKVNDENKKGQVNERERTKEQQEADKKESYVGVPSAVLFCHVCSKHMWDSESFEKHVRGRPHELMITYLDETYRMRVDIMRHQIKAVENQREIDLERVTNNKNKSNSGNKNTSSNSNASKPLLRSYCPMCDVRFYGPLTGHRKSDRHRKLKQFLHPECKTCDALFHTRLELDEHRLTAGHLKKMAELRHVENPHLKDDEFDLLDMIKIEEEEMLDRDQIPVAKKYEMLGDRDAVKLKLELEGGSSEKHREKKDASKKSSTAATVATDEVKDEEKKEDNSETKECSETKEENAEVKDEESDALDEVVATEETANDQSLKEDGTANVESGTTKDSLTAAYNPDVVIGRELVISSEGYVCRLCNCYLMDEQGVSIHCQTAAHYINYTTMTKMQDATSGGKKRGIDQVIKDDVDADQIGDDTVKTEENSLTVSQEAEVDSEDRAAKRIKLDVDVEENDKMDTSEQQETAEVKSEETENTQKLEEPVVQEQPAEVAQKPAAPVTTPTRGRGGGRGRGGRGVGGVARRGNRR